MVNQQLPLAVRRAASQAWHAGLGRDSPWRHLGTPLLDLVLPPLCLFCGESIDAGDLCPACERSLDAQWPPQTVACRRCGLPRPLLPTLPEADAAAKEDAEPEVEAKAEATGKPSTTAATLVKPIDRCGRCPKRLFPFDSVTVLGGYGGMLREAIVATKRAAHASLAGALGQRLAERVAAVSFPDPLDSVTFIPSHLWRRMMRGGAGGAERMAAAIGQTLGLPTLALLSSQRAVKKQSLLPPDQRAENVAGAFALRAGCWQRAVRRHAARQILLVDDVLTTGATAAEATRVLKQAGAQAVHLAVVARALH